MLAYFVSDVHLDVSMKSPRALKFLKWIRTIIQEKKVTHLFLLGDIFDLWVGEKPIFIQAYKEFIEALKTLQKQGVEIHYFEGNRDFLLRSFWEEKLHIFVHEKARYFQLGSLMLLLEHGDQIHSQQYFYFFWKWWIRTSFMKYVMSCVPQKCLLFLGQKIGRTSRVLRNNKSLSLLKMRFYIKKHLQKSFRKRNFDLFISGHFHLKDDVIFRFQGHKVRALNLGSWLDSPVVFCIHTEPQNTYLLSPTFERLRV